MFTYDNDAYERSGDEEIEQHLEIVKLKDHAIGYVQTSRKVVI
jgi:hypothetical protein